MKASHALILLIAITAVTAIKYEAEHAHVIGGAVQINDNKVFVKYSNTGDKIIFTINAVKNGPHTMLLNYNANSNTLMEVQVNGHQQEPLKLYHSSNNQKHVIELRVGINSLVLKMSMGEILNLDSITVQDAVPTAKRGATITYTEYEAEDAVTNGLIIGPERKFMTLPSEASGRRAVQLVDKSKYVEFTTKDISNAIVVRFSIPDTPDGKGNVARLSVLADSKFITDLTVTSKWSWVYGAYPFSKRPSDGSPHHFYDEARALFNTTLPKGTKIRLVPSSDIVYTIDVIDMYRVEPPYTQPTTGYVSIADYGADASGKSDSTKSFQSAIADAKSKGANVWIPKGTFSVKERFVLDQITIRGAGPWHSTVVASEPHGVGFFADWAPKGSSKVGLYDFAIIGDTNYRDDQQVDSGMGGAYSDSIIQNVWIEHTKCGLWLDGPFHDLHIVGITVRNVYADGVNFHKGVTNSVVEQSIFRNLGDDGLAMWSDQLVNQNNVFKFNTIQVPGFANGIAIYGGDSNQATDNYVADTVCEGGGLQASNRFGSTLLAGTTLLARSTLDRCGAPNRFNLEHNGAMWFWPSDGEMTNLVNVTDIELNDSSFAGITFWGGHVTKLYFENVNINKAPYAWEANSVSGQVYAINVVAKNIEKTGIHTCTSPDSFKIVDVKGNSGWNSTSCN
ncbi:cycloisomaltooligosaccharide glucanotransferase CTA1 [Acrasis kona]|uniref:Cycloisomaltooligosaccharide glucanotransferase CTA1 n=1 Tax=Acrasis kona TaxID=1008807 RepID=A0AAW2YLP5_9EUKA